MKPFEIYAFITDGWVLILGQILSAVGCKYWNIDGRCSCGTICYLKQTECEKFVYCDEIQQSMNVFIHGVKL